jgi:hypothetical protein
MRKRKSVSKSQQRLMGQAYACASGKSEKCPTSIMKVADSFLKKKSGMKKLKSFASTKHKGLPERIKENLIMKFEDFDFEKENDDVLSFLYSFKNGDINELLSDIITTHSEEEKIKCIESLLEIVDEDLDEDEVKWVEEELLKHCKNKKRK